MERRHGRMRAREQVVESSIFLWVRMDKIKGAHPIIQGPAGETKSEVPRFVQFAEVSHSSHSSGPRHGFQLVTGMGTQVL
jgi:hypothetical protein